MTDELKSPLQTVQARQEPQAIDPRLTARRAHQGKFIEAAHRLYQWHKGRNYSAEEHELVMDVWSLACIDPEPPTEKDIAWARKLFPDQTAGESSPTPEQNKETP